MAPAKGSKRGAKATAAAAAPPAKKAKVDPTFQGVVEAIKQAFEVPENCRKMLLACISKGLGTPCDERHESQTVMVKMIGDVVQGLLAKLQKASEAEAAACIEADARRQTLQEQVAGATEALAAATQEAEAKSSHAAEVDRAVEAAQSVLQDKEEGQRSGDVPLLQVQQSKTAFESGISANFEVIVDCQSEDLGQHYTALQPLLAELTLDEALANALPSSCMKKAVERGPFDAMVLDQLGTCLREKVAALEALEAEALPASQASAAAAAEARAALEVASAGRASSAEDLKAATAAAEAARASLHTTTEAAEAYEEVYSKATKNRDEKAEALENFKLYNVGCFELLRDRATSAPVAVAAGA
mmetsp:Transcript_155228/g.496338  ORF Transcript_155228/g.496338 Transcript_155228/m.496338 type:complete len:360 (-) Transcript_155228:324-1403(-)